MKEVINKKYLVYKDYLAFPEREKVELIEGCMYAMPQGSSRIHQKLITEIARRIGNHIENIKSSSEIYVAPFDVRFMDEGEADEDSKNAVQPDISVISDKDKLDDKGCKGAPDFIIEVVSPSNSSIDYVKKLYIYEKYGVREYWIANPRTHTVTVYRLNNNDQYDEPEKYDFKDDIKVGIFEGLKLVLFELI